MWRQFLYLIRSDAQRYSNAKASKGLLKCYLLHAGFRFSCWFRLHQCANAADALRVFRVFLTWCVLRQSNKTGIQINPGADIGEGLYMPHFGSIVINPKAVIGKNCYLSHNVLIGKVHAGKRQGVPCIGDDVFIGAGSVVLGNVKIGDNVAIAVNSVVLNDVLHDVLVAGAPAKFMANKGAREILGYTSHSETL